MRRWMWSVALVGLGLGSLGLSSGTAVGANVGPLAIGYGLLIVLSALYLIVGLAMRDQVWRRILPKGPADGSPRVDRLAGRRVF